LPVFYPVLFVFITLLTSCRHGSKSQASGQTPMEDGFSKELELVQEQLNKNSARHSRLDDESEWLALRAKIVEADKVACDALHSELELAQEMARYGTLNASLSQENVFLEEEQKARWNAMLEERRNNRIKAEARTRLLLRDLGDLRLDLLQKGYNVPAISVFE